MQSAEMIPFGTSVTLESKIHLTDSLTIFHFYDPSCGIAQNNIDHLKLLYDRYSDRKAIWYIVINGEYKTEAVQDRLGFEAKFIEDLDDHIASELGVINTPQLVILDRKKLYFRGSYLKNGAFCGADDITSSDAGVALMSSMKRNQLPLYLKDQKSLVGCPL